MSYRPPNWKKCIEVRDNEKRYTGKDLNTTYEAGADAMLEGLRKDSRFHIFGGIKDNVGGDIVFVPDEQVKNERV